jgi:hypothetical protein
MCFYFFIEKAPSLEYRISLILRSHLNSNEGMTFLEELSQFKQLSKRDQTWGSIILVSTWYIYYKYYRSINFHERTPFMSRFSSSFDDGNVENSSSYGVIIPGFEGHTLKFFIIHGLPFFFATILFRNWKVKQSFVLSSGIWTAVYLYCATFYYKDFMLIHPDSVQCAATLVSCYPLMGVSVVFGSFAGLLLKRFYPSVVELGRDRLDE